jgi:hypothetical protein
MTFNKHIPTELSLIPSLIKYETNPLSLPDFDYPPSQTGD